MSGDLRTVLEGMVEPETLLPEAELEHWRSGVGDRGLPSAVLVPASEEELASVLARASREGWRVLPAGFGGWLKGGGPCQVSLIVSTRRMHGVHEYEPGDLTFSAGAGLSLTDLRRITESHGQWLPLDPPGSLHASLGAVVSLGTGGSLRELYGTPRDHVLGLTLVSGDGRVLRWGGRVVKNVAGFDLTRLTVGSWGALGVVTSISARLFPIPEGDLTLVFRRDLSALLPAARTLALSGLPLAALELLDPLEGSVREPEWRGGGASSAGLVVRLLGSPAQVAEMESRIRSGLSCDLGDPQRVEGAESRALHDGLTAWEDGAGVVARLSLLPSRLKTLLEEAAGLRSLFSRDRGPTPGFRVAAHVGAGVLRVATPRGAGEEGGLDPLADALVELRARLQALGGSLTLSRGPDPLMKRVGAWGWGGNQMRLMLGLKAEFDPKGIMAPGRFGL